MSLQQTIPKEHLVKNGVYHLYQRKNTDEGYVKEPELAVFIHLGTTGLPIFHPLGEPSFQDVFALKNYDTHWVAIFERDGNREDLGG